MGYLRRTGLGGIGVRPGTRLDLRPDARANPTGTRPRFGAPASTPAPTRTDLDPRSNVTVHDYRTGSGSPFHLPSITGLTSRITATPVASRGSLFHIASIPGVTGLVLNQPPGTTAPPATTAPPKTSTTTSGGGGGGGGAAPTSSKPPTLPSGQGPSDLPDGSGSGFPLNTALIIGGAALAAYLLLRRKS